MASRDTAARVNILMDSAGCRSIVILFHSTFKVKKKTCNPNLTKAKDDELSVHLLRRVQTLEDSAGFDLHLTADKFR